MEKEINGKLLKIPRHVAIIMDGNGRWAKKRFLPRTYGHMQGSKIVEKIIRDAGELGIEYLTVYAFSTENWKRSEEEVGTLMKLLSKYLTDCIEKCNKDNLKVKVIGDISRLSDELKEKILHIEEISKNNTGLQFTMALNYGSRDEIVRSMKRMIEDMVENNKTVDDISEEMFEQYLDTKDMPDPDLMIRTSGEERLSNFMLWQLAYTEFYFTDVLWPDFNREELIKAIEYYNGRNRRFGGV